MLARRHTLLVAVTCVAALLVMAGAAHAQAPPALTNPNYGFPIPGSYASPANATSAALALSDRWLATGGYENPAAAPPKGFEISPLFVRINRQDVASENRSYEQEVGFPDFAGARVSMPAGPWGLTAYAWQPVVRMEEFSFSAGPLVSPAFVRLATSQRETRAGGAISRAFGVTRLGVSAEWVHREDKYETHEESGSPLAGDRSMSLKGDGYGVNAGVTWEKDPDQPWGSWFGAAIHYGSEIPATGTYEGVNDLPSAVANDTTYGFDAKREPEWSGGASGKVTVAPATRVLVGISFRGGEDWSGLGLSTGTGLTWSAGLDWKDDELPWGARFGLGQESLSDAIESKTGLFSLGFTWVSGDLVIDVGLLHRSMSRGDFPKSSDDRAVLSVKLGF